MPGKCEHGLTTRECLVCASPKVGVGRVMERPAIVDDFLAGGVGGVQVHNSQIREISAYISALEKDAARYAWLRKNPAPLGYMQTARDLGLDLTRIYLDSPEKLDAAIDAALAAEQKRGSEAQG